MKNGDVFTSVNFSDSWMKPCSLRRTAVRGAGRLLLTFVFMKKHLFISAALGLSCSMRDL